MEDIKIAPFPKDVMDAFKQKAEEIIAEIITKDPKFAKIHKSFSEYKKPLRSGQRSLSTHYYETGTNETAMFNGRYLVCVFCKSTR